MKERDGRGRRRGGREKGRGEKGGQRLTIVSRNQSLN